MINLVGLSFWAIQYRNTPFYNSDLFLFQIESIIKKHEVTSIVSELRNEATEAASTQEEFVDTSCSVILADEQQSQTISEVSRGSEATWTLSAPSQDIAESDSQSQIIYSSKLTSDDSDTSELEISNSSQDSKSSEEESCK